MHHPQRKAGGVMPYNYSQVSVPQSSSKLTKVAYSPFHKVSSDGSNLESKHSEDEEDRISQ